MYSTRSYLGVLLLALLLAGCGGGAQSSDSSSSSQGTSEPASGTDSSEPDKDTSVTVSGRAVKGVLQKVTVDAYALEGKGRRHLKSTSTDLDGQYELKLDADRGPVLLEVTAAGDGESTMICDAVDGCDSKTFGDPVAVSSEFRLERLVVPQGQADASVAITPLTHLASNLARAMPGALDHQRVQLARERIAGLLGVNPGYAFQAVPDITSDESLEEADPSAARHALMAAAFSEQATDTGTSVRAVIQKKLVEPLTANAGQLPNKARRGLWSKAQEIAEQRGILPEMRKTLDLLIAGLGEGDSEATTEVEHNAEDFERASVALDDLDHYLGRAGVDSSGDFLNSQSRQFDWLAQTGLVDGTSDMDMVGFIAFVSVVVGLYEDTRDVPEKIEFGSGEITSVYYFDRDQLVIQGDDGETSVGATFNITPIKGRKQVYEYGAAGTRQDDYSRFRFAGSLTLDFHDTDLYRMVLTLENMILGGNASQEDLKREFNRLFKEFELTATLNGSASVVKMEQRDFGFKMSRVTMERNWNIPALTQGGEVLSLETANGSLETPEGDWIGDNPAHAAPALGVHIGDTSTLEADLVAEAFGLPRTEIRASGQLKNTARLLTEWREEYEAIVETSDLVKAVELIGAMDFSVLQYLDFRGDMKITLDDMQRGRQVYDFRVEDGRMQVSLPNSTETALQFHFASAHGGYITAGDTLVATVSYDLEQLGLTLFLVDGSKRSYFLGKLEELIGTDAMNAVEENMVL